MDASVSGRHFQDEALAYGARGKALVFPLESAFSTLTLQLFFPTPSSHYCNNFTFLPPII